MSTVTITAKITADTNITAREVRDEIAACARPSAQTRVGDRAISFIARKYGQDIQADSLIRYGIGLEVPLFELLREAQGVLAIVGDAPRQRTEMSVLVSHVQRLVYQLADRCKIA